MIRTFNGIVQTVPLLKLPWFMRLSVGFEHEMSSEFRWGATYTYAYLGDNDLDATKFGGRIAGDYSAPLHVIGVYGVWRF